MKPTDTKPFAWSLWIPVILVFVVVILAWSILIKIARDHPSEAVPLEQPTNTKVNE